MGSPGERTAPTSRPCCPTKTAATAHLQPTQPNTPQRWRLSISRDLHIGLDPYVPTHQQPTKEKWPQPREPWCLDCAGETGAPFEREGGPTVPKRDLTAPNDKGGSSVFSSVQWSNRTSSSETMIHLLRASGGLIDNINKYYLLCPSPGIKRQPCLLIHLIKGSRHKCGN